MNLSDKTLHHLHKQYKEYSTEISLRRLFQDVSIKRNKISSINMTRYAEIGSPWLDLLSMLKHWVVVPPFITQEGWSFNKISVHVILGKTQHFLNTGLRKSWSSESKALSIITRNPSISNQSNN